MEHLVDEIRRLAESRGYRVEGEESTFVIIHPHVQPLRLKVHVEDDRVTLSLVADEIRDYIDDLVEERGEEEAREFIEEALSDMEELAAQIEAVARRSGVRVENRVRSGALDVLEALEDVLES